MYIMSTLFCVSIRGVTPLTSNNYSYLIPWHVYAITFTHKVKFISKCTLFLTGYLNRES